MTVASSTAGWDINSLIFGDVISSTLFILAG